MGVANFGSVDARVDPYNEQGKFGTTLKQSIPFGGRFAVTLQGSYSVTETLGQPAAGANDIPLMALPLGPGAGLALGLRQRKSGQVQHSSDGHHTWCRRPSASNDPVTHNTLGAEQKLYGPLQVTTAITDFGQITSSKSTSAGVKLRW